MVAFLHARSLPIGLSLVVGLLSGACKREDVDPNGTLTATITPLGIVSRVIATASDGQRYPVIPDPVTGLATFATLPAGAYTLTFDMIPASFFPVTVPVTVVGGQTTRALLPSLTHDGRVRGTMTWTVNGEAQVATQFGGQFGNGFYLRGEAAPAAGPGYVSAVSFSIATADPLGPPFAGAGTYLVGLRAYGPTGEYRYYTGGTAGGAYERYVSPVAAAPVGTIALMRFDNKTGIATGTFAFSAESYTTKGAAPVSITQGQFNVTF